MHFVFIPYGKRSEVELLIRDMEAQKHKLKMWKDKKEKSHWIQGQIRLLPFGVYEYIFPKEDLDKVLSTLALTKDRYNLGNLKLSLLRKMIKCRPIPKFKDTQHYLWIHDNVMIIPVGIREDVDITGQHELDKGWTHEAI